MEYFSRVLADGGVVEDEVIPDDSLNPSLLMLPSGVKAGKLYSVLPEDGSGDFTVDRNSTATRVNAHGLIESVAANVPRIDWSTGEPMLLVEGHATNLIANSKSFSDWSNNLILIPDSAISPDGNYKATEIEVMDSLSAFLYKTYPCVPNTQYNFSYYVKSGNASNIYLAVYNQSASNFIVQDVIKTVTPTWSKIYISFTAPANCNIVRPYIIRNNSFIGSKYYIWGAQLEQGSKATSYIPTNGNIATRLADDIFTTFPKTGDAVITFSDNSQEIISGIEGDTFTLPEGLIKKVEML